MNIAKNFNQVSLDIWCGRNLPQTMTGLSRAACVVLENIALFGGILGAFSAQPEMLAAAALASAGVVTQYGIAGDKIAQRLG